MRLWQRKQENHLHMIPTGKLGSFLARSCCAAVLLYSTIIILFGWAFYSAWTDSEPMEPVGIEHRVW